MQFMVYAGVALALLGLFGIGYCVKIARDMKRDTDAGNDSKDKLPKLAALNLASLGFASIGLGMLAVGVLLS